MKPGSEWLDDCGRLLGNQSLVENNFDPCVFVRSAYLPTQLDRVEDGAPPRQLLHGEDK